VPMTVRPVQQPHPPLWYGVGSEESIQWCAENGVNAVTLFLGERVRWVTDLYRSHWKGCEADMPLLGVNRHIVVAPTDEEAMDLARPAYACWRQHMGKLWYERTGAFPLEDFLPPEWDAAQAMGQGCAGTPETVRAFVAKEIEVGRVTYFVSGFAFGTLPVEAAIRSAELFASEVIPALGGD